MGQLSVIGGKIDQWAEIIIPRTDDMEYGDRHQCGIGLGNDDRPQNAQWAGAIHHGSFIQFTRQGHEILPEQEYIIRIGKE